MCVEVGEGVECVEVGGGAGECVKTNTANNHICISFSLLPSFSPLLPSFSPLLRSPILPSPLPSFIQSWDAFFRSTTAGAPPGHAYTSPSSLRPSSSSLPITTTQADPSVIRGHLRVQALIRAYQIRGHNIGTV